MALLIEATGRPTWDGRRVGWWLRRNMDRVVTGLVLQRLGDSGSARWRVEAFDGRPCEQQAKRHDLDPDALVGRAEDACTPAGSS